MVEENMNKLVLIALCLIMTPSTASDDCSDLSICVEGQYCDKKECKPCDPGFYQDLTMHKQVACKPWTKKHASEHWMVAVNGSTTKDIQYKCMPGYVQKSFTEGQTECVSTTTSTTTSTQAPTTTSSTPVVTSSTNNTDQVTNKEKFDYVNIIFICFGILVAAVLVMLSVRFIYKIHQKRSLRLKANNGTVGGHTGVDSEESIPLTDYARFLNLFREKLDLKSGRKFIRIIPDPSRQFKAQNRLQLNRDGEADPVKYHAKTLNDWQDLNRSINLETYLAWSTEYVGVNGEQNVSTVEISGEQLLLPEAQVSISTNQCFHKLCYFLGEHLGDLLEAFIHDLMGDSNLQLKNIMDGYKADYNDILPSFVDALVDWKSTQTDELLIARRFESALKQLNLNNLLNDRIYNSLIKEFQISLNQ